MPAHLDARPSQPGDVPPPRDAQPEIPVEDVAIGWVESADVLERGAPERDRRASQRVAADHGGGELTRPIHAIHRTEPAAPDPRLRHRLASLIDQVRGTGDQAN